MAKRKITRRLTAILAADVVGYSRLIRADEEGTYSALKSLRENLIDPSIAEHEGRIVKTMGDGLLVEFPSVVDAVRNAVEIQNAVAEDQAEIPTERQIVFRVGINLGDVVVDGDDIHGDGVNVAARLEGLADPGGIFVSETVYNEIRDRTDFPFEDLGAKEVKNIDRPVRVWRWAKEGRGLVGADAEAVSPASRSDKPSIAVLPFDNMSDDPEQAYFSDGIAENIITHLSRLSGLSVIARNSSFAFRGQSVDIRRVSQELGVNHVLEGSVRKAANRVRVTAQLVAGESGVHLWASRYDRDLDDIFAIQDEITQNIVDALKVNLKLDERENIGIAATSNMEAYDYVLRARSLIYRADRESNAEARRLLEKVLELDPDYIAAYWGIAVTLFTAYTNGWGEAPESALDRGCKLAKTAVELNPNDAHGHYAMALGLLWRRDIDGAIKEIEKAIGLAPSNAEAFATRGLILGFASRPAEAIDSLEESMRLDPKHPGFWLHFLAHAHFLQADYDRAVALLNQRIRLDPETDISRALLASCFGHLGLVPDAKIAWEKLREVNPDYSIEQKATILPYKNPADWNRVVDGLRKAGVTE